MCILQNTGNKSDKKEVERVKKLMEKGNAYSFNKLASYIILPRDEAKAIMNYG